MKKVQAEGQLSLWDIEIPKKEVSFTKIDEKVTKMNILWMKGRFNMKIIDGDKLLKEIKEMDLEYMQQVDIIDCLEDLINKQPGISKEININKVTNFDNRKVNK